VELLVLDFVPMVFHQMALRSHCLELCVLGPAEMAPLLEGLLARLQKHLDRLLILLLLQVEVPASWQPVTAFASLAQGNQPSAAFSQALGSIRAPASGRSIAAIGPRTDLSLAAWHAAAAASVIRKAFVLHVRRRCCWGW